MKKVKKYSNGGDFMGNLGKGMLDAGLSSIGLTNVIPNTAYNGASANNFIKGSNMMGSIGQTILPMAANMVAPGSGTAVRAGQSMLGTLNPQPPQGAFPYGGQVGVPNAEVEKQENTLNPDGSATQFDGPSHSQGGIPTQLDPNTLIFSDRLKLQGKTFAELNKANNTSKEDKVLEDSKANKLKRITANLMKEAKVKQSLALFQKQESLKQTKLGNYAKRLGIDPSNTHAYGGIQKYDEGGKEPGIMEMGYQPGLYEQTMKNAGYPMAMSDNDVSNNFDNFTRSDNNSLQPSGLRNVNPTAMGDDELSNNFNNFTAGSNNTLNSRPSNSLTESPTSGNGMNPNWMNIAAGVGNAVASNMGNIYDLKRASKVDNEIYNRVTPTKLDPTADLNYNNQLYRKGIQDVKNNAGGDASTYLGARTSLANVTGMNNSRVNMAYQNANAQIENQGKYYNAEVGDRQTIANMQNQAAARNLKSTAYANMGSTIGQSIAGMNRDNNGSNRDMETMKMILAQHPEFLSDPANAQLFGKYKVK